MGQRAYDEESQLITDTSHDDCIRINNRPLRSQFTKHLINLAPAWMVATGYLDPGNWAADCEAGAHHGLKLLPVLVGASAASILVQWVCIQFVFGQKSTNSALLPAEDACDDDKHCYYFLDLAEACRVKLPKCFSWSLWFFAQLSIGACEVANVVGMAVALQWAFAIQLSTGILVTSVDVLLALLLSQWHVECLVAVLMGLMAPSLLTVAVVSCFDQRSGNSAIDNNLGVHASRIDVVWSGLSLLGSTVMPHNIYLHTHLLAHSLNYNDQLLLHHGQGSRETDSGGSLENQEQAQLASTDDHQVLLNNNITGTTVVALGTATALNCMILCLAH